jgi:hypothetical protein
MRLTAVPHDLFLPSVDLLTVVKVLPAQRAFTAKINAGRGDPRLAQRNA